MSENKISTGKLKKKVLRKSVKKSNSSAKSVSIKPLKPSAREKKRYVAFEIISDLEKEKKFDFLNVKKDIEKVMFEYIGVKGMSKAGLIWLPKDYIEDKGKGIFRISAKSLVDIKESLMFLKEISGDKVRLDVLLVSGMLKKVRLIIKA